MFYLRYLYLLTQSGDQHIVWCGVSLFCFTSSCCPFMIIATFVFSND